MNITLSANGGRISEPGCDALDRGTDILFGRGGAVEFLEFMQGERGEHRPAPSAEILGGLILPGNPVQIVIDVGRGNILPLARQGWPLSAGIRIAAAG